METMSLFFRLVDRAEAIPGNADRALAVRLIARIEEVAATSGTPIEALRYLEVAGLPPLAESNAIFRAADAANDSLLRRGPCNFRTAALLNTLGFTLLQALPHERGLSIAQRVPAMPSRPAHDSMHILGDVVVVKFTNYGVGQKVILYSLARQQAWADLQPVFCVE